MSELIWPLQNLRTVMVQDDLGLQTWRVNIFPWYTFHKQSVLIRVNSEYGNTVEPVYNGHPRDLRTWFTQTSRFLILMVFPILNGSQRILNWLWVQLRSTSLLKVSLTNSTYQLFETPDPSDILNCLFPSNNFTFQGHIIFSKSPSQRKIAWRTDILRNRSIGCPWIQGRYIQVRL